MKKHYIILLILLMVSISAPIWVSAQNSTKKSIPVYGKKTNPPTGKRSAQADNIEADPNSPSKEEELRKRRFQHNTPTPAPSAVNTPSQPNIYSGTNSPGQTVQPTTAATPSLSTKMPAGKLEETLSEAMRSGKVMLNFDNIDIKAITKIMSDLTKKTIIIDKTVSGSMTIISSRKVSIAEAWDLYVSALEASGYGIVRTGSAYKLIPILDANKENLKYVGTKAAKPGSGYIVALILLNNADSEIMMNTLRPLVAPPGVIASYQPSNAVVITDTSQNVSRLTQIIKQLDTNYKGSAMRIFQPKYVRVKELATALQNVFQGVTTSGPGGASQQVKVSAYEPTNTLIVMAPAKEFLQIEAALAEIDVEERVTKADERSFKVYYLKNADAEEVAKNISLLLEEKKKLIEAIKTEQQGTEAAKNPETVVSTKVASDKATNSLMFYITEKEYEEIVPMIEKIDAPQKQILITAIVAETQLDNSIDAGVAWQVISDPGVISSFQGGLDQTGVLNSIADGRFAVGAVGSEMMELTVGGTTIKVPKIFGVIKALENKTNFNLLSSPKIVTHDHKEAKLMASQQLPFATGVKYDNNNQPIINYDYKDVGLSLNVTPHVGQNKQVRLELKLSVKDLVSYLTQGTGASTVQIPIISNRELDNIVTLENGQTIVIGGLIDQRTTEVIKQVPILSKIPLLGGLFKDKSTKKTSRTLFVFITPHIIDSTSELQRITDMYGRSMFKENTVNDNQPFSVDKKSEKDK